MNQKERLAELLSEAPFGDHEEKLSKLTQAKHLLLNLVKIPLFSKPISSPHLPLPLCLCLFFFVKSLAGAAADGRILQKYSGFSS